MFSSLTFVCCRQIGNWLIDGWLIDGWLVDGCWIVSSTFAIGISIIIVQGAF